jgi:monoamine oxidase
MFVVWQKIPFNQGAWISGVSGEYYKGPYNAFLQPDERIYFAGDYCSHLLTWQEGAALSAHRTVKMIGERARLAKA